MPYVETNGIRMYYEATGAGDPLILIMGITARGVVWEKHAAFWQSRFRCIAPDNRGVGFTDKPEGPYTSVLMAEDYAGLMAAMGISQARIVGCSMGSIIAQQLALRHPDRVRSMVLMCPWARCDRYALDVFRHLTDCKARLRPEEFVRFVQLLIYAKPSWDDAAFHHELINARGQSAVDPNPQPLHGLEAQAAACMEHNSLDALSTIRCPCLVIGGRSDIFTPVWMAEEVAARIPHCDLHLYEGAGHAFHWERFEDFNPRVLKWLL
ncbi:MAG: alpha/beta fold hydrolase, partial [Candidatus Dormibacteraceae bacterium]